MIATRLPDTLMQLARAEICLTDAIGTEASGRDDRMTEHEIANERGERRGIE
jgi:hypothetical protein